ncbi:hypothetical protein C8J57DRAFT_1337181 [Mycena rebaudengoi]|nr:hypothetical protein C8J57DRAFT_1337181 [Mycena rebaudengoi]
MSRFPHSTSNGVYNGNPGPSRSPDEHKSRGPALPLPHVPFCPTPPWLKGRRDSPSSSASSSEGFNTPPAGFYMLPPLEIISVPRQAKYLRVARPEEDNIPKAPCLKPNRSKSKPGNIIVPPNVPIAIATARTPSVPPPISAVQGHEMRRPSTPLTPLSPGSPGYVDPDTQRGLVRAVGLRAFPIRTEREYSRR